MDVRDFLQQDGDRGFRIRLEAGMWTVAGKDLKQLRDENTEGQARAIDDAFTHLAGLLGMSREEVSETAGDTFLDSLAVLTFGTMMDASGWPDVFELLGGRPSVADILSAVGEMTDEKGTSTNPVSTVLQVPPQMRGAHVLLTAVLPPDTDFLYGLAISQDTGFRWRFRGAVPSYQTFLDMLWEGVNAQFVIRDRNARPVGHAIIYNVDFNLGLAYVGVALDSSTAGSGVGVESTALLIHYAFCTWALRICYMELPEYNFSQFASGEDRFFEVQGRLRDADIYGGKFYDRIILAISRERFYEHRVVQRAPGL